MSRNKKIYIKVIKVQRELISSLRKDLSDARRSQVTEASSQPVSSEPGLDVRPQIFRSEMDYISRCILDYPNIETGGQLFGYWTSDGIPVIMYAIGPGPSANHQGTFFNQDVNYLLEVGNVLRDRYCLQHIGEWHSHHRLGLARPSGHDINTMQTTIREKNLGRFLLCIGNCDNHGSSLNPFMCDDYSCVPSSWNIIEGKSPVRRVVDSCLSAILVHPRTMNAAYSNPRMNPSCSVVKPQYASSYWLNDKRNGIILNRMQEYLRSMNYPSSKIAIKLDDKGLVHIVTTDVASKGKKVCEDIIFPAGFPDVAPLCTLQIGDEKERKIGAWRYSGDIFSSFVQYYNSINN